MADEVMGETPLSGLEELKQLQEQGDLLYVVDADGSSKKMQANVLCWQLVDVLCGGDAGLRRMVKRGADLSQWYSVDELAQKCKDKDFSNVFIDDYLMVDITTSLGGSETVRLDVADFDYFYNCGSSDVKIMTDHHIVFVPHDQFVTSAQMNSSNTTEGGYLASAMHTDVLPVYYNALNEQLNGHILSHSRALTSTVNTSATSAAGSNLSGSSTATTWTEVTLELMSPCMVYGANLAGSSFRDAADACMQLAKFALCPEERVSDRGYNSGTRGTWWLCAVTSSASFAYVNSGGSASSGSASSASGVRPYFLFG